MKSKVISTIGVGVALLVGGWSYYAVLSTMPAQASATVLAAATQPTGPMAMIAAHASATNAAANQPGSGASPAGVPGSMPNDPNAVPGVNPAEIGPPLSEPGGDKSAPKSAPRSPIPAEKWDFDFDKKPLPSDVK